MGGVLNLLRWYEALWVTIGFRVWGSEFRASQARKPEQDRLSERESETECRGGSGLRGRAIPKSLKSC